MVKKNKTRKAKQKGGKVREKIEELLTNDIYSMKPSVLKSLKTVMTKYIASPWDAFNKHILSSGQYKSIQYNFLNYHRNNNNVSENTLCKRRNLTNTNTKYQQKLCQSHSGNLFQHSQWSALQIIKWNNDGDEIMNNIDLDTAIVSAFFHDIGKGGDCVETCRQQDCWFDMYASGKYNGKGDQVHPKYCGDMILGKILFKLKCRDCNSNCSISIKDVLELEFPNVNVSEVACAAYMHWEFGKLNIPGKDNALKIKEYYDMFFKSCKRSNLEPSKNLLMLCVAVACADITAGTNIRLLPDVDGLEPADGIYLPKDPWILFGMDKKYLVYRQMVLDEYPENNSNMSGF